jgi:hypothetical protein
MKIFHDAVVSRITQCTALAIISAIQAAMTQNKTNSAHINILRRSVF